MKALSLTKPYILTMIGLPGSGKSFFARQFSETFRSPIVSSDQIRHRLYPEPSYDRDQKTMVQAIAHDQLSELLKTQKTILLDGGANTRQDRIELRKKAQEAGYDVLLIWVQTDNETSKYRSMKRSSKKADDQYNVSLSADLYEQFAKKFTPPLTSENSMVISGKHTYATQAKIVLKKLAVPRAEAATATPPRSTEQVARSQDRPLPPPRNIIIR